MKTLASKFITVGGVLALVGLSGADVFLRQVLMSIWPVAAAALALVLLAGASALAIWFVGAALARVRELSPWPGLPASLVTYPTEASAGPVIEQAPGRLDNSLGFRQELTKFAIIGNSRGFSLRSMTGHVTRPAWELYTGLLVNAGVLVSGKGGTSWAPGWGIGRLKMELRHDLLSLPYPNGKAPAVQWLRPGRTAQLAQHTHPAQATQ